MIKYLINIFIVAFCSLSIHSAQAQNKVLHYHDWELYLRGGITTYLGEVKGGGVRDYDDSNLVFAGGLTKSLSPNFQLAGDLFSSKTSGSIFDTQAPTGLSNNYYFQADLFGMSVMPKANLSRLLLGKNYRFRIPEVWIGAGVGMLAYRSIRRSALNDEWQASVGYYLEGSRKGPMAPSFMIPVGVDVKLSLTKSLKVGVSYYTYVTTSDKLDTILDGDSDSFSQLTAGLYIQIKEKKVRSNGTRPRQKNRTIGKSPSTKKKKLDHRLLKFKNTN